MKPRQRNYGVRSVDESAAYVWWLDRRSARWSVALHKTRSAGDDRDADLMLQLVDLRACGAYANVRFLQVQAGEDGYAIRGKYYSWVSPVWACGAPL